MAQIITDNSPALALSDIMHTMSPSPPPRNLTLAGESHPATGDSPFNRTPTPDTLQTADADKMRNRVHEMGLASQGMSEVNASSREKELADMVLKLTSLSHPDSSQLVRQAETIAELTRQREFLLQREREQALRWGAERESWTRTTEALIRLRAKKGSTTYREEELTQQVASIDADNRALRAKVAETQIHIQDLQAELNALRPLLIVNTSRIPYNDASGTISRRATRGLKRALALPDDGSSGEDAVKVVEQEEEEEEEENDGGNREGGKGGTHKNSSKDRDQTKAKAWVLHREGLGKWSDQVELTKELNNESSPRGKKKKPASTIFSDARAEHLLLAARKLGRERIGLASGSGSGHELATGPSTSQQPVHETARERPGAARGRKGKKEAGATSSVPKTPRRGAKSQAPKTPSGPSSRPPAHHPPTPTAMLPYYVVGPSSYPHPILVPIPPGHPHPYAAALPQTPSSSTPYTMMSAFSPNGRTPQTGGTRSYPHTPMDSLLTAAQSMMEDDAQRGTATAVGANGKKGRAMVDPTPDTSPTPKRRKVGHNASQGTSSQSREPPQHEQRVRSALDVLADQAAGLSTGRDVEREKGKGKEKAKETEADVAVRRSGRRRGKEQDKELDKGKGKEREEEIYVPSRSATPMATSTPPSGSQNKGLRPFSSSQSPRRPTIMEDTQLRYPSNASDSVEPTSQLPPRAKPRPQAQVSGQAPLGASTMDVDTEGLSIGRSASMPPRFARAVSPSRYSCSLGAQAPAQEQPQLRSEHQHQPEGDSGSGPNANSTGSDQVQSLSSDSNSIPDCQHGFPTQVNQVASGSELTPKAPSLQRFTPASSLFTTADSTFNPTPTTFLPSSSRSSSTPLTTASLPRTPAQAASEPGTNGSLHVMRISSPDTSTKRARNPYQRWTEEEDQLLTQVGSGEIRPEMGSS